nr:unnamed protein product [Spirometra erinaceieuropaei]
MVRRGSQVFQRLSPNRQNAALQVNNPTGVPPQLAAAPQLPNSKRPPTSSAADSPTPLRCKDEFFGGLTRSRRPPHETSSAFPRHSKISGDLLGTITGLFGHESQGDCCEVCRTTKFADNAGHNCAHCNRRTCIRCGGYFGPESSWFCRDCFSQLSVPSPSSMPMSDASTAATSSTTSKVQPPVRPFVSDSQSDGSQRAMSKASIGYAGVANRTGPRGAVHSHRSVSDEEKTWSYVNQYPAAHGHEISPPPPPPRVTQSSLGTRRQSMYHRLGRPLEDEEFDPYARMSTTRAGSRQRAFTNDSGMLDPRMRRPRHRADDRPISETSAAIHERGLTEMSPRLSGHYETKAGGQLSHRREAFSSEGSESPLGSHGAFSSSSAAEDQQRELRMRFAGQDGRRAPVDAGSVSEPCQPETYLKHTKLHTQLERFHRHSSVADRPGLKRSSFWSPSSDGESLIGQVYLRCPRESSEVGLLSSFGLKLVIGKRMPSDLIGTFISHVQEGSVADVVGSLQIGDEILEWNGHSLRGLHQEQVSEVLALSCESSDVWMIVQRILDDYYTETRPTTPTSCAYNCNEEQNESEDEGTAYAYGRNEFDPHLQLKLRYNEDTQTLNVCVLSARDLPPLFDRRNLLSSSFCQVCVLPESSKAARQFTRVIPETNNPVWVHTFTYNDFSREDVTSHELEVAVFDSDNERVALVGEVLIDLSVADLSGRAYWYPIPQIWNSGGDPDLSNQVASETGGFQQDVWTKRDESRQQRRSDEDRWRRSVPRQRPLSNISPRSVPSRLSGAQATRPLDRRSSRATYGRDARSRCRDNPDSSRIPRFTVSEDDQSILSDGSEISEFSNFSKLSLQSPPANSASQPRDYGGETEFASSLPRKRQQHRPQRQTSVSAGASYTTTERSARRASHRRQEERPELLEELEEPEASSSVPNRTGLEQSENFSVPSMEPPSAQEDEISGPTTVGATSSGRPPAPSLDSHDDQQTSAAEGSGDQESSKMSSEGKTPRSSSIRKRRPSIGHKFSNVLRISKKSTSQSNSEKKSKASFQRSEEVLPAHIHPNEKTTLSGYTAPGAVAEGAGFGGIAASSAQTLRSSPAAVGSKSSAHGAQLQQGAAAAHKRDLLPLDIGEAHLGEFVEGLGPGQLVGRQVLGMPCLGEIQLSFFDRKGHLEVEVIRARGLQQKNTSKPLPTPYVKLHLLDGKQSVEKMRTSAPARRTLDPLFQQQFSFSTSYKDKILQVSVWGEYGRMDKKVFLGMCEIVLDDLNLRSIVFGWYKLFGMIAASAQHHHHSRHGVSKRHSKRSDSKASK